MGRFNDFLSLNVNIVSIQSDILSRYALLPEHQ